MYKTEYKNNDKITSKRGTRKKKKCQQHITYLQRKINKYQKKKTTKSQVNEEQERKTKNASNILFIYNRHILFLSKYINKTSKVFFLFYSFLDLNSSWSYNACACSHNSTKTA